MSTEGIIFPHTEMSNKISWNYIILSPAGSFFPSEVNGVAGIFMNQNFLQVETLRK